VATETPVAVVASAGNQALAVVRGLGEQGVPVVVLHWDDNALAKDSRYVVESVKVPRPELDGEAFVDRLLALGERYAGGVLIPTTDGAVKDVARHKPALERHYRVDAPSWEVAQRYIDKRYTYEIAEQLGVPIPRTLIPTSDADVEAYAGQIMYPCLVKPRQSHLWMAHFDGKLAEVDSPEALFESYTMARDVGVDVVLQERIPGPDHHGVNHNAYRSPAGTILAECTARKIRQGPPRFGLPRVVLSTEIPEVMEPGRRLLEALGHVGFACTEFKFDARDGRYKLLEVNGRHNLSSMLSIRAGVNFPWISYNHLVTGEVPSPPRARSGLYWIDEWLEISQSRTRAGRDSSGVKDLARPWIREHVFAVFDTSDPAPFRTVARTIGRDAARVTRRTVRRAAGRA
jgi:D-aspartate ligase